MKIGILGCGVMAETFADTLRQMGEVECYAAASRTLKRAEEFAGKYGFKKAYGSYEELCADPEVELIYIATPHSSHFDNMKLCIRHKKPVLCEKSFTVNAREAEQIREYAEQEQVFVAEAIWTRYMPSRNMIQEIIDSGIIGDISVLTANLSYPISHKERIMRPELAGGALLDIGVYGVNFAMMHFGTDIERIESSVRMTDTGVDAMESITIFFRGGRMAVLTHDIYSRSDRKGIFYGEKGYIIVENINNPQSISVYDTEDRLVRRMDVPKQISGYEYEVLECIDAVRSGEKESSSMPLSDSIKVMGIMDQLRGQWGLVYPRERETRK
ncbi:MAG TPA: Gfo/Idh/MocA family oxidoreductase [Candidatus Mediterraneibacter merdigallinarum]|nr:Gfo/Idh/MocA family oxidoreductase [Candidatus Mediterraneibacter merdigallinarum]